MSINSSFSIPIPAKLGRSIPVHRGPVIAIFLSVQTRKMFIRVSAMQWGEPQYFGLIKNHKIKHGIFVNVWKRILPRDLSSL